MTGTGASFPVTRWSLVQVAAGNEGGEALERICRDYWYPLYAFARRSGNSPADSEDLTQGFFHRMLEKGWLAHAEREKGRLRTYMLTAFHRYMTKEWRRGNAECRGGKMERVCFEMACGEIRYATAHPGMVAEALFDRQWALELMERTLSGLRSDFENTGKIQQYEVLKEALMMPHGAIDYSALAARLSMSEGAVRVAVHRLRKRFRAKFREEVADTLEHDGDLESELSYLAQVLSR